MIRSAESLILIPLLIFGVLISSKVTTSVRAAETGDATRGKALFEKRCSGCHSLDEDREGPRLRTVYGRKAGSVSGYPYSKALQSSKVTWDDVSLEKWLTNPDSFVPENNMSFYAPKADERADIIRFLKVTSEQQPAP